MRILIVLDTDWLKRNPAQHHHIAERLSQRGHEIRVIDYEILWRTESTNKKWSERHVFENVSKIFPDSNITVIRPSILKIPLFDYVSMLFTYNKEIKNQIKSFKPDIIIGHSILSNYLAMRQARKNKIPFIFHLLDAEHTLIPFNFLQPFGKMIESQVFKNADEGIVINELLRDYAINMGASPDKTYVITAGVDLDKYNPDIDGNIEREKQGLSKDDFVLFFMGWLYHFSGLKDVITTLAEIEDPHVKLLIVGDGDAFDDLNKLVDKYNLHERVILTGKKPFKEIPNLISTADVCILPALYNKTMKYIVPIKIYEYMAMGKPVITTKLPGVMKEFGNGNGVLYVDKPEDVMGKAMDLDIEVNGKKARKYAKNHNWDKITDKFENKLMFWSDR